jgi:DNA mismatch repair protein MutL
VAHGSQKIGKKTVTIKILDPLLANQIAAGEVVERPASVLKELLENSIDAGATQIKVDLEGGGIKRLVVNDNGSGIVKEDLPLALSRHATSKISTLDDLEKINSLGFRGEALASIGSVSRLCLTSTAPGETSGWEIYTEGSLHDYKLTPKPHLQGTTIAVEDLFFNTPARRKFLRTERTELMQIELVLKRILFSRFDIQFQVKHQQKMLFNAPIATTQIEKEKRLAQILGADFIKEVVAIESSSYEMSLTGWITLPQYSRSQPDMQYFYVNGRVIRDKLINHALRQAYQDVMYNNRHPGYVLYLNLPPELVDVNVHPTKHEVRFRDSRLMHDFIYKSVRDGLQQITPVDVIEKVTTQSDSTVFYPPPVQHQPQLALKETTEIYSAMAEAGVKIAVTETIDLPETTQPIKSLGYALGQLHGIYILAQNEFGLIMVDMHAAHERVLYEKFKIQYRTNTIKAQQLLMPLTIPVAESEANLVEDKQSFFAALGFVLERLNRETVVLRQVPTLLQNADLGQLIKDILADENHFEQSQRVTNEENEILGNIACRAAVRANSILTIEQMNALLRDLEQTPNNGVCNHGRPTWQQFTLNDLDKFFLRGR